MWKIVDKLYRVWVTNIGFIFLFLVLNLLTGAANNIIHEIGISILTKLLHGFVNVFLVAYLIAFVKDLFENRWWKIGIVAISLFISLLLCGVELFLLINFNTVINPSMVLILLETNGQEAVEFLQTYGNVRWIVLGLALFIVCVFYKGKLKDRISSCRWLKAAALRWVLLVVLFLGLCAGGYRFVKDSGLGKGVISPHMKTMLPIQRLYYSYVITLHDLEQYELVFKRMGSVDVEIQSNHSHIRNIVLIIGESLGRNHMSLYGYSLPTTPSLDSLYRQDKLYRFSDVICPSLYTSASIQKIMSFFNNESTGKWYDHANIIDVMKAADYKTFWISNQEMIGVYGNYVASLGRQCDDCYFNNKRNSIDERYGDFDEDLIAVLKNKLQDKSEKKFIVLHFMGSHPLYRNRYPEHFEIFQADDESIPYGEDSKEMAAQYDNTVLYNDYVLSEIVKTLEDTESILIYLSDHGNEVYDERDYTGRSEDNISRYMVEVPFLIWESDRFKASYPEKDSCIACAVDRPYMTDDLIHTIIDLADIRVEEYDSTRSVINPFYNKDCSRVICGYDYDAYNK